jgi:hypothetical protein
MILYYALGSGLGHLTRGRRVLEALGLVEEATFVTASPYADDVRVTGGIPVIVVPQHLERDRVAHRAWLGDVACRAERLIVDTFPCGIQGEVVGLDVPMDLVARLLRWNEYRRVVPDEMPGFDTVWRIEELTPEHEDALRSQARRILPLDLGASPIPAAEPGNYWVVVHSGPEEEVRELVEYAEELRAVSINPPERVVVASPCPVPLPCGFVSRDVYPAAQLFPGAARIISAAGFNVMLETEPWRAKHVVLPFARKFDDQYRRAARRRA